MNPDILFKVLNNMALFGWVLLIGFPHTRLTRALVLRPVLPAVLAVAYFCLVLSGASAFAEGGGFGSLDGVKALFANPQMLLAGWTHYLVFDLIIGSWIVQDAKGTAHWKLVPALLLTFLFGPVGWLLYQVQKRFAQS